MNTDLNHPGKIKVCMKMTEGEIEPIYWRLEDSLYDGKVSDAEFMFDILIYVAKYRKDLLSSALRPRQRDRLKEITYELNGEGYKRRATIVSRQPLATKKIPFQKEKLLKQYLADNIELLSEAIQEPVTLVGVEVETDCEYACDIVVQSPRTYYPIELKITQADHRVVSQILKYCYYFYRRLRYDKFKEIQGIVISNGMDAWSINELRREGIGVYDIMPDGDKDIKLNRITDLFPSSAKVFQTN